MDHSWNPTTDGQDDVEDKVYSTAAFHKRSDGRKKDDEKDFYCQDDPVSFSLVDGHGPFSQGSFICRGRSLLSCFVVVRHADCLVTWSSFYIALIKITLCGV